MNKHLNLIAAAALSIGGFTFVGCDDGYDDTVDTTPPATVDNDNSVGDDLERAGEDVERGMEKTGDAIERGVDRTGDALNEAGRDIREGADRTEDRLDNQADRAEQRLEGNAPATRPINQPNTGTVND